MSQNAISELSGEQTSREKNDLLARVEHRNLVINHVLDHRPGTRLELEFPLGRVTKPFVLVDKIWV